MKVSKYNHFIPFDSKKSIAYNALSNALAFIENENLEKYYNFANTGENIYDEKLVKNLKHGSFLIDNEIDELGIIRFNMLRTRFATTTLNLTIAPTSDCNFRCVYCYQKEVLGTDYMSETIQDAVVQVLEDQKDLIKKFSVTWYGGEPLLALPIIKHLTKEFLKVCEQNEITYNASMITNGYLLTRENLSLLKELQVSFIQITLDGGPENHNKKRPLANGDNTFSTIFENLQYGYDLLPRVSLRVNIDKENLKAGNEIKQYLFKYDISEKVKPYFGCIRNSNDCYDDDKCINACEFAEIEYNYALDIDKDDTSSATLYPKGKSSFCGADSISCSVIAADGGLYRCWSDIGNAEKCVGNILEPFNHINAVYLDYMLFDPTHNTPCMYCNVLPICMGGCPFQRMAQSDRQCTNYKYILHQCLDNAARKLTSCKK